MIEEAASDVGAGADAQPADELSGGGVGIHRATGCFRDLNWDLELESLRVEWDRVGAVLAATGWPEVSHLAGLHVYVHPAGAEVVIVPRSQWIQLRLSYITEPGGRRELARAIAREVAQRLGSA